MRTYRAGSLTLTNASTSIVGVGTAFVANVAVGDIVVIENGQCLEVVSVPDDTHLTVSSPAKQSGSFNYAALRFVMAVNFRDLSIKIEQFLTDRQFTQDEFSDWMSGSRTGGPNGDGRYPLTDRNKVTKMFMCPELIAFGYQDSLDQAAFAAVSATAADASKTAAATSATAAATAAAAADASKTAVAASAAAAATSATAANTSKVAAGTSETNALASKTAAATSATNSATSATASAGSATASAGSATASAASVTAAATSATNANASATAAATSATAANTSKIAAGTSETNALASKNAAAISATNAGSSETASNTSKLAAAASATAAATSETNALASKNAAAASSTAAATSVTTAAGSATAAAASSTAASSSATAAATSATDANASKIAAGTSETNALASKSAAATSETNALASKNAAATSEANADISEANAATSATAAAGSATAANVSKLAAAVSEANALASATSAAAGSLSGLDKMPTNLISNPTFISTASLSTTDVTNGKVSYVDSTDVSVPVGCPTARVGVSLKKVASQLLTHAFPLANAVSRIPCVPGEKFDVCIWMNVVGGPATGSAAARLTFVESDAVTGGTFVANTRVLAYDQVAGGWQKLNGTFTASATTRSFTVGVWNETAMPVNGTIFFAEPELARRNSIMGLLGSMGFGDYASPIVTDLNANTIAGPFQCAGAVATASGLPNNVIHSGIQLRQSSTANLQIVAALSSTVSVNRKLYWRNSFNSVWTTWNEVAAANGGTLTDIILAGTPTFTTLSNNAADATLAPTSSDGASATAPSLRITGLAGSVANAIAAMGFSNSTANFGSTFIGTRSLGAVGAHAAVTAGRSVCTLMAAASDGTDYRKIGRIDFYTDEVPTATSAAGQVRILTTSVGAILPSLAATFTNDNRLVVVGGGSFGGDLSVAGNMSVTGALTVTGVAALAGITETTVVIASAATTNIGTAASNVINVTGTTAITALGIAPAGTRKQVRFSGVLTLTHNATSLNLIGNANIVTAVDDIAEFRSNGSGNWSCTNYVRAAGVPLVSVAGITVAPGLFDVAGAIDEAPTVTIASNTTTNIATAASNSVTVTGTVAIGALGTATAGVRRIVKFAGVLVLAHNATSLILPTGANITTAVNDTAEFLSLGSGNWICSSYQRANGKAFGLDNVDNTSDATKPISTATATALAAKAQQGTGIGQTANIVKIGYTATGETKITIDNTDQGAIVFKSFLANSATIAAAALSATADTLVQRDAGGNIYVNKVNGTSIEVGRTDSVASTPFVDFHSGATAVDYDTRIISDAPTGVAAGGRMTYIATGGHVFTGPVDTDLRVKAGPYTESKTFANQLTTDAPFVIKTQTLNAASEYSPIIKMKATLAGSAEAISMGVLSDPTLGQSLCFHWGNSLNTPLLLSMKRDGSGAQFSGAINANKTIYAAETVNAAAGCYNNGQLTWSRADFNPNTKMAGADDGFIGACNRYNRTYAQNYQNFNASLQAYNGAIEIRENGLVATGGAAPLHIYNAPGITFHWAGCFAKKLMMSASGYLCWGDPSVQYSMLNVDGNIYGTAWGGWLNEYIAAALVTKSGLLPLIALNSGSASIGSHLLLKNKTGAFQGLDTLLGSASIAFSDTAGNDFGAVPGTWRSLGAVGAGATGLFLRIA